ncbi:hypothetical protein R3P38DRAFT_3608421 [Favolaschia claudopus]|uniref:Uncharacterized protein n=1 Tax=Favolaschia claudopus TaxID=2862362 RepID=A0AAW0DD72_9AGAR
MSLSITLVFVSLLLQLVSANSGIYGNSSTQIRARNVSEESTPAPRQVEDLVALSGTNFARMKLGLPPLPPTRRASGLRPRTSPLPCASTGYIKVTLQNAPDAIHYLSKTFDAQNSYTITQGDAGLESALRVTLWQNDAPITCPYTDLFDILARNGPDATHPWVGAVAGSGGSDFRSGQMGYSYLTGTGQTPANSKPSSTAGSSIQSLGYNGPVESMIWYMGDDLEIMSQWVNDNTHGGQILPSSALYDPTVDFLGTVGDYSKFSQTFASEGPTLAKLTFVPITTTNPE